MPDIIEVDDVCTHDDLVDEVGSKKRLGRLMPDPTADMDDATTTRSARIKALDDVLIHLGRRRPPIREGNISHPEDLKRAVLYATLERLFGAAMHGDDGTFGQQRARFERRLRAELQGLSPRVDSGLIGASGLGIPIHRR